MTVLGDPIAFAPDFGRQPEPYGEPMRDVLDACIAAAGPRILDVAGGYGRYAIPLASAGHFVEIVDLHEPSLLEARRRARIAKVNESISVRRADVRRDALAPPRTFDLVVCIGFLHHLDPDGGMGVVRAMADAACDGGRIVFEFSTEKHRRLPDGTPILVGGAPEHCLTQQEGLAVMRRWLDNPRFSQHGLVVKPLEIREPDFFYDAEVIIATAQVG